jgi:O-antigen/teichoic acid export membrane protein
MSEMKSSHLRWSYLSTASTAVMQLAAAVTITRFLQPSDYGLAALAMLCYSMVGYFTQLGVGRVIVQKPGLTEGNIRAAFTLGLATGTGGFVILAALSPLLGIYFHEKRLPLVILVFGLNLIFQSLGMVACALLRRDFRIRDLAICDFLGYLLSTFGVGLPMAMHGYGVWALVGSNVSQPLISTVAYFIARPHPILPTWVRADYAHVIGFSAKASLTTTVEALGASMDMIVMGRILSPSAIGLYNRSLTLSTLPGYNISMGLSRVFHPTLARAAERSREECCRILMNTQRQLMSLIFPFCAGAAMAAPVIIPVIFGRQWASAVPVYQVLCLVAALDASHHLPALQLEILSLFRHKIILQGCFGFCFGLGILFFAPRGGIVAVAWFYAFLQAVRTLGMHALSARSLGVSVFSLLRRWTPGLVCAAAVAAVLALAQRPELHFAAAVPALNLGILVVLSAAAVALVYRLFYRSTVYRQWMALFER